MDTSNENKAAKLLQTNNQRRGLYGDTMNREPKYYKHKYSEQIIKITNLKSGGLYQEVYIPQNRSWIPLSNNVLVKGSIMYKKINKREVFLELL